MKTKTFKGGIHPPYNKEFTRYLAIEEVPAPKEMVFLMSQHLGAPSTPVVNVGDRVFAGQLIATASAFISANIHSSVSGTVTAIKPMLHPNGAEVNAIIVENDFLYEPDDSIAPNKSIDELSAEEIREIVRNAGIVGMGGAAFPTHIKLAPPPDKNVEAVIINAAECEPYLTSDHRVLLEGTEGVLNGLKACMKALNVSKGYVAVEDNKEDAIDTLRAAATQFSNIEIVPLETKYPQGSEKHIIKAVTGREVPPGGLPADAGVAVINVETAYEIYNAIVTGMPLISRIVTIGGDAVKAFRNYRVRVGTSVAHLIESVGGFKEDPEKILLGGPMMGISIFSTEVPIIKGTGAVLAFTKEALKESSGSNCMRCGKCVDACPMNLQPVFLGAYGKKGDLEQMEKLNVMDCIECGACSYLCPGRQNPLQYIRTAKLKINNKRRKG